MDLDRERGTPSLGDRSWRLLLVAQGIDPARGGQERSILEYVEALVSRGVDVTLAAGGSVPPGARVEFVPLAAGRGSRRARLERLFRNAEEVIKRRPERTLVQTMIPVRGADVYLPRGGLFPEAHARSRASHRSRWLRAAAWLGQCFDGTRRCLRARERSLLDDPAGPLLVALSDYVRDQALWHYDLPESRVRVIRNGVDLERIFAARACAFPPEVPREAVVFLVVAHNARLKGVPALLRALPLLPRDPSWCVVIAGGSHGRPRAPDPRVVWLGAQSDVPALLLASHVLVHPTYYDPSSRVVLEAMGAGVPVITTRWNGAADFLEDPRLIVDDPADAESLAAAMTRLLDRSQREFAALAMKGRSVDISIQRHAVEMIELFDEVWARRD